jgi:alpha-L-fucosidase 2
MGISGGCPANLDCVAYSTPSGAPGSNKNGYFGGKMIGCGTWSMHNLYLQGRHAGNTTMLREVLFPMLRAFVQVYNHHKFTEEDGQLHLPYTSSPEYPKQVPGNDTNYDVALFRWGAATLLELASEFDIADPLVPEWTAIVGTLTPGPIDSGGSYMVNSMTPFNVAHRHFSHLFHIYPLHVLAYGDSTSANTLITTSLDKWTALTCGSEGVCPNGFTYDGAASMSALIPGRAAAAVGNLTQFVVKSGKVRDVLRVSARARLLPLASLTRLCCCVQSLTF